jgi:hypothetical protein
MDHDKHGKALVEAIGEVLFHSLGIAFFPLVYNY